MITKSVCSVFECRQPLKARGYCDVHYRRVLKHGDPLIGCGRPHGEIQQWIRDVAVTYGDSGCLTWPFAKAPKGYGMLRISGKMVYAHRYICQIVHGDPPTCYHVAAHSCGLGHEGCVSPLHLDWKTPSENEADKIIHGTSGRGGKRK